MEGAKALVVKPIPTDVARAFIARVHYSGSYVYNSQVHLGVFWNSKLEGVMQFGPPIDRRKILGLVAGCPWEGCLELNRMAFSDALPRNSESRALAVAFRLLKRHAPQVQFVVSFADATQCGDGTIYRAAGFWLTGIRRNASIWAAPTGETITHIILTDVQKRNQPKAVRARALVAQIAEQGGRHAPKVSGAASMKDFEAAGFRPLDGFQIRYIYPLRPDVRERLTVPVLPFFALDDAGARMYKGQRAESIVDDAPAVQAGESGSSPTSALLTR